MPETLVKEKPNLPVDIAIGISDGIVIPFALLAGLSGAVHQVDSIKYVGMIAIIICAAAMGVSAYLTGKEDRASFYAQMEEEKGKEERAREILSGIELNEEVQEQVIHDIRTDKLQWREFLQKYEVIHGEYTQGVINRRALNIGFAYAS